MPTDSPPINAGSFVRDFGELYEGVLHHKKLLTHSLKLHSMVMNETCHIWQYQYTILSFGDCEYVDVNVNV